MWIIRWIDYPQSPCSDNREFAVQYCYIVTMVAFKRGWWSARTYLHQHLQRCNKTFNKTSSGGWRVNVLIHHNQTRMLRQNKEYCTHNTHVGFSCITHVSATSVQATDYTKKPKRKRGRLTFSGSTQNVRLQYTVSGRRTLCVSCPNIRPLNMFIEWNCLSFRQKGKLGSASFLPLWISTIVSQHFGLHPRREMNGNYNGRVQQLLL